VPLKAQRGRTVEATCWDADLCLRHPEIDKKAEEQLCPANRKTST
jgi:hypothetical protein